MKRVALGVLMLWGAGCSGDVFDAPDAAGAFPAPPRLALRIPDDAGSAEAGPDAGAEAGDGGDAGCAVAVDPSPYCAGACATADGGLSCGNVSNGACSADRGFYGECSAPSDCAGGKLCALVPAGVLDETSCPPSIASEGLGVTATCADPSYLAIVKGARVLCRSASDCEVLDGGAHACVGAIIVGYPALAGETVGVCE